MKFFDKERHLRATSKFATRPQEVWFPQLNRWVPVVNPRPFVPDSAKFSGYTILGLFSMVFLYPITLLIGAIGAAKAPMGSGTAVGGVLSFLNRPKPKP